MKQKKTWNYTVKQCAQSDLEDFINGMDNQGYDFIQAFFYNNNIIQIYKSRETVYSVE